LRWVDLSIPSAWENDGVLWPELLIWKFGMDSDLSLEVNRIFAQAASNGGLCDVRSLAISHPSFVTPGMRPPGRNPLFRWILQPRQIEINLHQSIPLREVAFLRFLGDFFCNIEVI
jgi:hypothetical protein